MKGCFILQRRFVDIGHNLAVLLKEKKAVNDFCAYVLQRPGYDFLNSQKDIKYDALLLDEDVRREYKDEKIDLNYLGWLEKEYGIPNLWPYLTVDRIVMSNQLIREYPYDNPPHTHEEMLQILQITAKATIKFLEKEKPSFIFASVLGSVGPLLLYHIAKKKGIKTWIVLPTLIKHTYTLSEHYACFTEIEKRRPSLKDIQTSASLEKAKKYVEAFREQPFPYYDECQPKKQPVLKSQQLRFLAPKNLFKTIAWTIKYFCRHFTTNERHDYSYIGPFNYIRDAAKRKLRNLVGINDLYDEFNPSENFAFFPLHYEPEVSLLLTAPFHANQAHVILQAARALPVRYKLYVKEHPLMVPYRPRSFYKQLKKIPNVKLISPTHSSFQIISSAKLIITIVSTVGWEAAMLKKPVIVLGEAFYNTLSFVRKCPKIEDLPQAVKEHLLNYKHDENELINYIAAIFEESAEVNLQYLWELETNMNKKKLSLEPLADLWTKKLTPHM